MSARLWPPERRVRVGYNITPRGPLPVATVPAVHGPFQFPIAAWAFFPAWFIENPSTVTEHALFEK